MINLRFHLVSLVAVFLALGLGVAMGASFVNRATVETLQGRVDAVEASYKDRGSLLDTLSKQLRTVDGAANTLVGPKSPVLPGRLAGQPVVEVLPAGLDRRDLADVDESIRTAGASFAGAIRLTAQLDLLDTALAARVREALGLRSGTAAQLRSAALSQLADALAVLSAPIGGVPPVLTRVGGPSPDLNQIAAAEERLRLFERLGLIELDGTGASPGTALPDATGVTYLMVVANAAIPASNRAVVALADQVAQSAPAASVVGELAPARDIGGVPVSTSVPDAALLGTLRTDDEIANRLSTVDDLDEAFGRLAAVLAIQDSATGGTGHYGNGPGATAPFPLSTR